MGSPHSSKQSNWTLTFFIVYGSEAVLPADLLWTSPKIEQYEEGEAEHTRRLELDSTEEVRINTTLQLARYLQGLRRHYNKSTKQCSVQVGDLVLQRIQKLTDTINYSAYGKVLLLSKKSLDQAHTS
jgi:hypothetical protein